MNREFSEEEVAQKSYYNAIAVEYDRHYAHPEALKYRYEIYDRVFGDVDLVGKRVLDAACGGGESTGYFRRRGASVVGVDIADECCRIYKARFPDAEVVCSSILDTKFDDASFDVVMTDSLHHLHPHVEAGVDEILRVLKPGGLFVCWEPSANSIVNRLRRVWYKLDRKYFRDNEEAIDVRTLFAPRRHQVDVVKTLYGGNLAYLFVSCSMAFRIPTRLVKYYAGLFRWIESVVNRANLSSLSLWVLCSVRKKPAAP